MKAARLGWEQSGTDTVTLGSFLPLRRPPSSLLASSPLHTCASTTFSVSSLSPTVHRRMRTAMHHDTTIRSRIDGIRGGSVLVFEGFFSLLLRVIRKVCMCAIYIGIFVYESVYFFTWVIFSFDKYLHDGDYLSFCCLSWRQLSRMDFTVESNILLMMMTISREGRWIFIWPGRSLISFFVSLMRNIEVWLVMLRLLYA